MNDKPYNHAETEAADRRMLVQNDDELDNTPSNDDNNDLAVKFWIMVNCNK